MVFYKGYIPWNKEKILGSYSKEHRAKISQALKGRSLSEGSKKQISNTLKLKGIHPPLRFGCIPWNKGKKGTTSQESIDALKRYVKENGTWNKGKQWSEQVKQKMSESHKGYVMPLIQRMNLSLAQPKGKNHWNWKGGISEKGYSVCWTQRLKDLIQKRDNHTCQSCANNKKPLDIHHIDNNKENNNSQNLITLCRSCHITLHNGRGSLQRR